MPRAETRGYARKPSGRPSTPKPARQRRPSPKARIEAVDRIALNDAGDRDARGDPGRDRESEEPRIGRHAEVEGEVGGLASRARDEPQAAHNDGCAEQHRRGAYRDGRPGERRRRPLHAQPPSRGQEIESHHHDASACDSDTRAAQEDARLGSGNDRHVPQAPRTKKPECPTDEGQLRAEDEGERQPCGDVRRVQSREGEQHGEKHTERDESEEGADRRAAREARPELVGEAPGERSRVAKPLHGRRVAGEVVSELRHDTPPPCAGDARGPKLPLERVEPGHASTPSTAWAKADHSRRRCASAERPRRVSR